VVFFIIHAKLKPFGLVCFANLMGLLKKCFTRFNRREEIIVGTALVAVLLRVRTGIHPEGLILKDKPCPYIKTSP